MHYVKKDQFYLGFGRKLLLTSDIYNATAFSLNDAEAYAAAINGYMVDYSWSDMHSYALRKADNHIWWNFSALDDIRNQF